MPGLAGELDALKSDLSSLIVSNKVIVHDAVGPPAGSKRISDAEAARGLDTTYGPNVADRLKLLTIGQLVKLTQDTIRVRKSQDANDTKEPHAVPEAFNPIGPATQATQAPQAPQAPTPMPSAPPVPPIPDLATAVPTLPPPMSMPPTPMPTPMPTSMPAPLAPQAPPVQVSEPLINLLSQQSGLAPPL